MTGSETQEGRTHQVLSHQAVVHQFLLHPVLAQQAVRTHNINHILISMIDYERQKEVRIEIIAHLSCLVYHPLLLEKSDYNEVLFSIFASVSRFLLFFLLAIQ